jgi:2-keto-4-pentenoate hydratase
MVIEKGIQKGERVVGRNVGATSQAILEMLRGVTDAPMFGCMTTSSVTEVESMVWSSAGMTKH